MFKKITISNFKSFKNKTTLSLHEATSLYGIWGLNDTGKTNFLEAFQIATEIFKEGMRYIPKNLYYIFEVDMRNKPSLFEFEFGPTNRTYRYGFEVDFFRNEILTEYLMRIDGKKITQVFHKQQEKIDIGDTFDELLSKKEKQRFKTYLYDVRFDKKTLFASHMKEKDFYHSPFAFFNDIHYFFNRMYMYQPESLIHLYKDMGEFNKEDILAVLNTYDANIEDINYEGVTLDELRLALGRHRYDHIIDTWRGYVIQSDEKTFLLKAYDKFYRFAGKDFNQLVIYTLEIKYKHTQQKIPYDMLSSGLKQLISILLYVTNIGKNSLYIYDQMTDKINALILIDLIPMIQKMLKKTNSKLIFSSHDLTIFDQNIIKKNEIAIMHRTNLVSMMTPLTDYKIRNDKVLSKAYMQKEFIKLPNES